MSMHTVISASARPTHSRLHRLPVMALSFAVSTVLGSAVWLLPLLGNASDSATRIVADPNANRQQQPTILNSANGTVQVDIQTPSAAGVSRNLYQQFDVGADGAILNNARNSTQTTTGGWVQGNPWLARGAANVILNEVNSANPSILNGYLEVAGQSASVVVANPSGLSCNGCGVINANRFTLTTGAPIFNAGQLEGYQVNNGHILIHGRGLDGSRTPYTDLIARTIRLNAGVFANDLSVILGQNTVSASNPQQAQATGGGAPSAGYALDVGQLGGMYAGKIFMVGTEQGMGVNNAGVLAAQQGTLQLSANGDLTNSGQLLADQIQLSADALNNSGGKINQTGVAGLALHSGGLSNQGGVIGVASHTPESAPEPTPGDGGTTPSVPDDGDSGSTGGNNAGTSSGEHEPPAVLADGVLRIQGLINNDNGEITAGSGIDLSSSNGLDNAGGTLVVRSLDVTGDAASTLNNNHGTLFARNSLTANVGHVLNNDGELAANHAISLTAQQLQNQAGRIQAGERIDINADHIDLNGALLSSGDLSLTTRSDLAFTEDNTQTDRLYVGNNLRIDSSANISNQGLLNSGNITHLSANTIDNHNSGRIYGGVVALQAEHLTNDGAVIAARERLAIGANHVLNQNDALMLSLGDLSIGGNLDANLNATGDAQRIQNRSATIESIGNMTLAAQNLLNVNDHFSTEIVDVGSPEDFHLVRPEGTSSVLQPRDNFRIISWSRAGKLAYKEDADIAYGELGVAPIPNVGAATCDSDADDANCIPVPGSLYPADDPAWAYFNIAPFTDPEPIAPADDSDEVAMADYQAAYDAWEAAGDARYQVLDDAIENYNIAFLGRSYRAWTEYEFTRTQQQTAVTSSAPARIISGGDLTLRGESIVNDKSQIIAGGHLQGDIDNLTQIEAFGEHISTDRGRVLDTWSNWRGGFKRYHERKWSVAPYAPAPTVTTINLNVNRTLENQSDVGTGNTPEGADQFVDQAIDLDGGLPLPGNGLFSLNVNNPNAPLVVTDPRFTDYRNWLSSDYLLQQLSLDPSATQKRLGDGFYEQTQIREQVQQLTGQRYLPGYGSDEAQYMALMNNGLSYAQQYNLRPGIALTADQVAQLTSDIVWLVPQQVTLLDGSLTTVLAPQVYVRPQPQDLSHNGTLIAANSIQLNLSGDLNNQGSMSGRQVLSISADNVNQHGGRLQGDALLVDAQRDINNVGGSMTAKDVMWLNAGGDVNLTSTTQSNEVAVGASRFERTTIDRVAGLYVSGESDGLMVVNAGGDINATASIISNQSQNGQTLLDAAVAINLKTLKTTESEHIVWTQNQDKRRTESSSQEVGTVIRGAGDVALNAGENLNARAAQVAAGEVLQLSAGQDISIEAGRATEHLDVYQHRERRSTFSKSSTTIHNKDSRDEAVASNLEGAVVDMQAGNDLSLKGSTIISDNLTRLQAGNDINIIADENHYVDKQFTERKKSGFSASFSAGTASVGYGKSQESNNRESQSTTASASGVMSLAGDTELVAGNTLTIAGSDVAAGNNVALMAKEVELRAAQENLAIQQQQQRKSSGISVGVVVNPIAAFESAYDKRRDAATSPVGQVMAIADAAQDVVDANGVRIGSQKSSAAQNTEISTARVSTVQAGGNLNIMASDGSIVSEGARLSAEGNALLLAKENIVLGVAENTEGQRSNSRSSGWSVGASSMPVGINQGRATGQGDTVTASGSTLSVGGDATLATTHGDVRVTGSQAVAGGDLNLNAARDLTIESAENRAANANRSKDNAIGQVEISDTERFKGYHSEKTSNNNQSVTQVASSVGSLGGNVNATAGNQYTQTASDVVAANDITITAKAIDITSAQNTGSSDSRQSSAKVGFFSRISSPIIDLFNNSQAASESDGRLQAMQSMAAAGNAYQAGSAIASMAGTGYGSGSLLKAETGVGVATSKSSDGSQYSESVGNTLSAGNNINLVSTEGDITLQQTQATAGNTLALDSANDIVLRAGESTASSQGKSSSYGAEVGAGVQVGAQTGVYVYAQANAGKGKYSSDGLSHSNTELVAENISLTSQGDTTLAGATARAERIDADVGGTLSIESLQDTQQQHSSQTGVNARVQASLGTAWDAQGGVNAAKADGDSAQVGQQSGLFAGDGGYHVNAKDVELKGGAIASTNAANSNLNAETLTFSHINNHMNYQAAAVGVNVSVGGQSTNDAASSNDANTQNSSGTKLNSLTPSVPIVDRGSDQSTTYATLTDGNITIAGQNTTASELGLHTDASTANQGLKQLPDIQQLLKDQQAMQAAVSTITASVSQAVLDKHQFEANQAEQIKADILSGLSDDAQAGFNALTPEQQRSVLSSINSDYAQASDSARHWGTGGDYKRAVDVVTTIVTGVGSGQVAGQVATNAIAPYASQFIGSTLSDDQAAQLLSHAVLGAVMAYANNGNAATGAVAAAGAEAAADYLAKQLYPSAFDDNGRLQRDRLNENEVQQLLALTNAVGAVVGAVSSAASGGDSIAVLSGFNTGAQAAQNAVENNYLSDEQETDKQKALAKKQFALKKGAVYVKYEAIDKVQDIAFVAGYAAGVPGSVIEGLGDLFTAVLNPRETVAAMRELLKSDDVLGVLSDSVRQDFEDRLANIESEYQRGGTGAFNAGYEQSKLLTELSAVAIGGVGAVTSGIKVIARQIVSGRSDSGSSHSGNNVARGEADDFYQRNPDGSHYYPEKLGFVGQPKPGTIKEGTILDRYGDNDGSFLSPHGVPINQRALPPADEVRVYRQYEVLKPLPVLEGKIAPAYGSAGGGIQLLPNFTDIVNIDWLIRNGFLKEL